jgi:hypothetical protein
LAAQAPLAAGHLVSMLVVLLPFALMTALLDWQREIRIGASVVVIAFGAFRLVNRRHPRALARIRPTQLALWSFAIATAHGAGLMLLPIYLGLCSAGELDTAHQASSILMGRDWLGLKFISKSWFDLDFVWAVSLILIGAHRAPDRLSFSLVQRHGKMADCFSAVRSDAIGTFRTWLIRRAMSASRGRTEVGFRGWQIR